MSEDENEVTCSSGWCRRPLLRRHHRALRRVVMQVLIDSARHNGHADLLRERIDGATGC